MPLWILACYVGLGLIEYYRKNYTTALEQLWNAIEKASGTRSQIIGNVHCILANVYREMDDVDMALTFYTEARRPRQ